MASSEAPDIYPRLILLHKADGSPEDEPQWSAYHLSIYAGQNVIGKAPCPGAPQQLQITITNRNGGFGRGAM